MRILTNASTSRSREEVLARDEERQPCTDSAGVSQGDDQAILTGGWQTDKEHAYVALSRARERTQLYVAREDLGEQGMDVGAIERLAERMRRSGAQEASVAREVDEKAVERKARIEREIDRDEELDRGLGIE